MRRLIATLGVAGMMLAGAASPALADHPDRFAKAERMCEKQQDGSFIRVDSLVYVCLLPTSATQRQVQQAARECKRQGGALFVGVGNLVYACVLPTGTLPGNVTDPDGDLVGLGGLILFPIVVR